LLTVQLVNEAGGPQNICDFAPPTLSCISAWFKLEIVILFKLSLLIDFFILFMFLFFVAYSIGFSAYPLVVCFCLI
jgi:hypothetical protein